VYAGHFPTFCFPPEHMHARENNFSYNNILWTYLRIETVVVAKPSIQIKLWLYDFVYYNKSHMDIFRKKKSVDETFISQG
jgi:hypothetical protein